MNTEQERADFEVWFEEYRRSTWHPLPSDIERGRAECPEHWAMNGKHQMQLAWQARAALQSQDREDAERLDWLERHDGWFYNLGRIACVVGAGFRGTEQDVWHPSLREAIDHARRAEENE